MQCYFYQLEEQILHVEDLVWFFYIHYYTALSQLKGEALKWQFFPGRKEKELPET